MHSVTTSLGKFVKPRWYRGPLFKRRYTFIGWFGLFDLYYGLEFDGDDLVRAIHKNGWAPYGYIRNFNIKHPALIRAFEIYHELTFDPSISPNSKMETNHKNADIPF